MREQGPSCTKHDFYQAPETDGDVTTELLQLRVDRDDVAAAQERPHQLGPVHGLAGHDDQGNASHSPHQGQPAVRPHLLLLTALTLRLETNQNQSSSNLTSTTI